MVKSKRGMGGPGMDPSFEEAFSDSYEESRAKFRAGLDVVRAFWPNAGMSAVPIGNLGEDLTIDFIEAFPVAAPKRALIITSGEHGCEAFAGAAVIQHFLHEFPRRMDPAATGLLLVHSINPWGMKHLRRVNENNVDLNRNFVWDWDAEQKDNPDYRSLETLLNPPGSIVHPVIELDRLMHRLIRLAVTGQAGRLKGAVLRGQYEFPRGIYYGGCQYEDSSRCMMALYRKVLQAYDQILHLDIHTGYGPARAMTIVNSPLEKRNGPELQRAFGYPHVVSATPGEFYAIAGDMIDYIYRLRDRDFPERRLYATCFEFGTLGDSFAAQIDSLRRMIAENRAYWHGTRREKIDASIRRSFRSMFQPESKRWKKNALEMAHRALEGILQAEGYLR